MKKALTKNTSLYHVVNRKQVEGPHSGLRGDCSGLRGDLDECEITDEDRATGVNIEELIS